MDGEVMLFVAFIMSIINFVIILGNTLGLWKWIKDLQNTFLRGRNQSNPANPMNQPMNQMNPINPTSMDDSNVYNMQAGNPYPNPVGNVYPNLGGNPYPNPPRRTRRRPRQPKVAEPVQAPLQIPAPVKKTQAQIPAPTIKVNPNPVPVQTPVVPLCNVCRRPIDEHTIAEAKNCGIIEAV